MVKILSHALQRQKTYQVVNNKESQYAGFNTRTRYFLADEPIATGQKYKIMDALTKVSHKGISVIVSLVL